MDIFFSSLLLRPCHYLTSAPQLPSYLTGEDRWMCVQDEPTPSSWHTQMVTHSLGFTLRSFIILKFPAHICHILVFAPCPFTSEPETHECIAHPLSAHVIFIRSPNVFLQAQASFSSSHICGATVLNSVSSNHQATNHQTTSSHTPSSYNLCTLAICGAVCWWNLYPFMDWRHNCACMWLYCVKALIICRCFQTMYGQLRHIFPPNPCTTFLHLFSPSLVLTHSS